MVCDGETRTVSALRKHDGEAACLCVSSKGVRAVRDRLYVSRQCGLSASLFTCNSSRHSQAKQASLPHTARLFVCGWSCLAVMWGVDIGAKDQVD